MKTFFLTLFCLFSTALFARGQRCFHKHIVTAKKLNLERKELYEKNTDGKSVKIIDLFISIQDTLLPISYFYDKKAAKFQTLNPKFFCQEFVDMIETPEFKNYVPATTKIPRELNDKTYSSKSLRNRLKAAFKKNDFTNILEASMIELKRLEETPSYFCMTRHFLESIARTANFTKYYSDREKEISKSYIKLQIFGMIAAGKLDKMAAPFQEKGISILCQDMPTIPLE
jgi:hypothetical protein